MSNHTESLIGELEEISSDEDGTQRTPSPTATATQPPAPKRQRRITPTLLSSSEQLYRIIPVNEAIRGEPVRLMPSTRVAAGLASASTAASRARDREEKIDATKHLLSTMMQLMNKLGKMSSPYTLAANYAYSPRTDGYGKDNSFATIAKDYVFPSHMISWNSQLYDDFELSIEYATLYTMICGFLPYDVHPPPLSLVLASPSPGTNLPFTLDALSNHSDFFVGVLDLRHMTENVGLIPMERGLCDEADPTYYIKPRATTEYWGFDKRAVFEVVPYAVRGERVVRLDWRRFAFPEVEGADKRYEDFMREKRRVEYEYLSLRRENRVSYTACPPAGAYYPPCDILSLDRPRPNCVKAPEGSISAPGIGTRPSNCMHVSEILFVHTDSSAIEFDCLIRTRASTKPYFAHMQLAYVSNQRSTVAMIVKWLYMSCMACRVPDQKLQELDLHVTLAAYHV